MDLNNLLLWISLSSFCITGCLGAFGVSIDMADAKNGKMYILVKTGTGDTVQPPWQITLTFTSSKVTELGITHSGGTSMVTAAIGATGQSGAFSWSIRDDTVTLRDGQVEVYTIQKAGGTVFDSVTVTDVFSSVTADNIIVATTGAVDKLMEQISKEPYGSYCGSGWTHHLGDCYMILEAVVPTLEAAEDRCAQQDAHLASYIVKPVEPGTSVLYASEFLFTFATAFATKMQSLGQTANLFWIGAADPTGTSTLFQWTDGTMFERPPGVTVTLGDDCMVLDQAQNSFKTASCVESGGEPVYPFCMKPSTPRNGVRFIGCYKKTAFGTNTMRNLEGQTSHLQDGASSRNDPIYSCKQAVNELMKAPTVFGISQSECYSEEMAGRLFIAADVSQTCSDNHGSADSFSVYEEATLPKGWVGCFRASQFGTADFTVVDSLMTVTECREICAAAGNSINEYRYAALKGEECRCYANLDTANIQRGSLAYCGTRCPGNKYQRCGLVRDTNDAFSVYSSVKYHQVFKSCEAVVMNRMVLKYGANDIKYYIRSEPYWKGNTVDTAVTCPDGDYQHSNCPDRSWVYTNGHCVKVIHAGATAESHRANCRRLGGDLYVPTNTIDLHHLKDYLIGADWSNYIMARTESDSEWLVGGGRSTLSELEYLWADGSIITLERPIYNKFDNNNDELSSQENLQLLYIAFASHLADSGGEFRSADISTTKYQAVCSAPLSNLAIYEGCYAEALTASSTSPLTLYSENMHVTYCMQTCLSSDYSYAQLSGKYCRCLNDISSLTSGSTSDCGESCAGFHHHNCGKTGSHSAIYNTGIAPKATSCSQLFFSGIKENGDYYIDPDGIYGSSQAYKKTCNLLDNSFACPQGWYSFNKRCYFISSTDLSYDAAHQHCLANNGLLYSPTYGEEEDNFLIQLADLIPSLVAGVTEFYIGIHQAYTESNPGSASYYFLDGSLITENHKFIESGSTDFSSLTYNPCVVLTWSDKMWKTTDCDTARRFICRKDPEGPPLCVDGISENPQIQITYHRMSLTFCREFCQAKSHQNAVVSNTNTCSCYDPVSFAINYYPLSQCNYNCPTNKYQSCGGDGGKMTATFSGSQCQGDAVYDADTQLCYRYLPNLNKIFWDAVEFCSRSDWSSLASSIPSVVQDKWPDLIGKDVWLNGFRYNLSNSNFYSYLSNEERPEFSALGTLATGRCVTVRSDGSTHTYSLVDCDSVSLPAVCVKQKAPYTVLPSNKDSPSLFNGIYENMDIKLSDGSVQNTGYIDYNTYCDNGIKSFALSGTCYKDVPVTFTRITDANLLTACKSEGLLPATVPVKTFSSFDAILKLLKVYPTKGAMATGIVATRSNKTYIATDGSYLDGLELSSHIPVSDAADFAINEYLGMAAESVVLVHIAPNRMEADLVSSSTKSILCSKPAGYLGCYDISGQDLYIAYDRAGKPNTAYQCIEECRALGYSHSATSGTKCRCSDSVKGTKASDQSACRGSCSNTQPYFDICGDSAHNTATYIDNTQAGYTKLPYSCDQAARQDAMISGKFNLELGTQHISAYCHMGGEILGNPLVAKYKSSVTSSSPVVGYGLDKLELFSDSACLPQRYTVDEGMGDPYVRIDFGGVMHFITAFTTQGNGKYEGGVAIHYGSFPWITSRGSSSLTGEQVFWRPFLPAATTRNELHTYNLVRPPLVDVLVIDIRADDVTKDAAALRLEVYGYPVNSFLATSPVRRSYKGHTYFLSKSPLTYSNAQSHCDSQLAGSYTALLDSADEESFVIDNVIKDSSGAWSVSDAWLGITDEATEGKFLTHTGRTPSYTNWKSGELGNDGRSEADCVSIQDGGWSDVSCTESKPVLCESDHLAESGRGDASYIGCFLDKEEDNTVFYPAGATSSSEQCIDQCSKAGFVYAAYNSTGAQKNTMTFAFHMNVLKDASVKVVRELPASRTALSICLSIKVDREDLFKDTKDRCFLGSTDGSLNACIKGSSFASIHFANSNCDPAIDVDVPTPNVDFYKWTSLCLVASATDFSLYVNGVSQGSVSTTFDSGSPHSLSSTEFLLFGQKTSSTGKFYGMIRKVNIWKTELSPTEVMSYHSGSLYGDLVNSDTIAETLISDYKFSQGVQLPSVMSPIIVRFDLEDELTISASSATGLSRLWILLHVLYTSSWKNVVNNRGGWCSQSSDSNPWWSVKFTNTYTIYSMAVAPVLHKNAYIKSFNVAIDGGSLLGYPAPYVFTTTIDDYYVTLPQPATANSITIKVLTFQTNACGRFEFYGFPTREKMQLPETAIQFQGNQVYHISPDAMDFATGQQYCRNVFPSGYISVPSDAQENTFLRSWSETLNSAGNQLFIGLYDVRLGPLDFKKDDGTPTTADTYTAWNAPQEPNDLGDYIENGQEDCGSYRNSRWNDISCLTSFRVFCEANLPVSPAALDGNCYCGDTVSAQVDEAKCSSDTASVDWEAYRPVYSAWRSHCKPFGAVTGATVVAEFTVTGLEETDTSADIVDRYVVPGTKLTFTCGPGYISETFVTTCHPQRRTWSVETIHCTPIKCPDTVQTITAGTAVKNGLEYLNTITYTCQTGYYFSDTVATANKVDVRKSVCQADASWSITTALTCQNCGALPNGSTVDHSIYESIVRLTCPSGYAFNPDVVLADPPGQLVTIKDIVCLASGEWNATATDFFAYEIWCKDIPTVDNSQRTLLSGTEKDNIAAKYKSEYKFKCETGYAYNPGDAATGFTTEKTTQCTDTGSWSPSTLGDCALVQCPAPVDLDLAVKAPPAGKTVFTYEDATSYVCNSGYATDPNDIATSIQTVKCLETGEWGATTPCQAVVCPVPTAPTHSEAVQRSIDNSLDSGVTTDSGTGYYYKLKLTYECSTGFAINPNAKIADPNGISSAENLITRQSIVCKANGQWDAELLNCEKVKCPIPQELTHATVSKTQVLDYQDKVEYVCVTGYDTVPNAATSNGTFQPSQELTCSQDGDYTPTIKACSRVECPQPDTKDHSELSVLGKKYQDTAKYTCHTGYAINYQEALINLPAVFNTESTITCQNDGTWTAAQLCKAIECKRPTGIQKAVLSDTGYTYNSVYTVACETGFTQNPGVKLNDTSVAFIDSQDSKCTAEGIWDPQPKSCGKKLCPPITRDFADKSTEDYKYDTEVTFTCHKGYRIPAGKTTNDMTAVCTGTGQWSVEIAQCEAMLCTMDPTKVPDATVDVPASRFYDDIANITCNEGYEYPDGSVFQQVKCSADADFQTYWTSPTHTFCQRVECFWSSTFNSCLAEVWQYENTLNGFTKTQITTEEKSVYEDNRIITVGRDQIIVHKVDGVIRREKILYLTCLSNATWNATELNCTGTYE